MYISFLKYYNDLFSIITWRGELLHSLSLKLAEGLGASKATQRSEPCLMCPFFVKLQSWLPPAPWHEYTPIRPSDKWPKVSRQRLPCRMDPKDMSSASGTRRSGYTWVRYHEKGLHWSSSRNAVRLSMLKDKKKENF